MFICLTCRNFFFLHNRFDSYFYNPLNRIFGFFLSYKFSLFFIIRSSYSNFSIFARSYFFFFAHFHIFIIDVLGFKWFFHFLNNWFYTNCNNFIYWLFSCLEFALFRFYNFTIFYNKGIRSFLFSWFPTSFFTLSSFKIWIILNFSFIRKFLLLYYIMSSIVSPFPNLDKSIFCWYYFVLRFAINLRIFDLPSCSLCSDLTWSYNFVFTFLKGVYFFYLIAKR